MFNRACCGYHKSMTASDHLSGAQFMPMHQILGLTSVDAEAANDYRAEDGLPPKGTTVADILPQKRADIARDPAYYGQVEHSMRTTRGGMTAPLGVSGKYLLNGGHRVALAQQMGWAGMHVSDDFGNSTDESFDATHERTMLPRMTY